MINSTYTSAQTVEILELAEFMENADYRAAVVDYLGFVSQDASGRFRKVTEQSPVSVRFGIRSIAHVHTYKFPVILLNRAARIAEALFEIEEGGEDLLSGCLDRCEPHITF